MRFHVLTLFPQMIEQGLSESITGRALKQNIISLNTVNIRDFAHNKHNKVDDYTYGGGAGMLMQAEPVYQAVRSVVSQINKCNQVIIQRKISPMKIYYMKIHHIKIQQKK